MSLSNNLCYNRVWKTDKYSARLQTIKYESKVYRETIQILIVWLHNETSIISKSIMSKVKH